MFNEIIKKCSFAGSELQISTGKIARQADGAVMVRMGDAVVQCTAVYSKKISEGVSFFPLTVNYQEKTHAAGKIPGGFLKREGRGSEKEVLVSRLIDRPIRPLFNNSFFNETQVICTTHSHDAKFSTDIMAIIGASAALAISGVPFTDIIAASRVGLIDGEMILNPSYEELSKSKLDLIVAGTKDSVMMVESEAEFLTEKQMLDAVKFAHDGFQPVIEMIEQLKREAGKPMIEVEDLYPARLKQEIESMAREDIILAFTLDGKQARSAKINEILNNLKEHFVETEQFNQLQIEEAFWEVKADVLRQNTLKKKKRIDGRLANEIRQIECEIALLPSPHGSSLFTRGETQAIVTTTLGTGQDEQIIDCLEGEYKESFLLNYQFPPYSVGETAGLRAPSRREVGHGKLAWRSLRRSLPDREDFPYTVRVVSEITESNGSSSMATVCAGSMSMMDAGIPLKKPISGIAMGLIKEKDDFIVLSDIIADEDSLGDMDFKVAGSDEGITALQMDIKVAGITFEIMQTALDQAKEGRVHILKQMAKAITRAGKLSDNAPMIQSFMVSKDKIRDIIGPGGKMIREICDTTTAKIDITDDGTVSVSAIGQEALDAAVSKVKSIAIDPEPGDILNGKVVKILEVGAFINYAPGRDGFIHISELSHERVGKVGDIISEGQELQVKLIGFERGKGKLSIKRLTENPNKTEEKLDKVRVEVDKNFEEDSKSQDRKALKNGKSSQKKKSDDEKLVSERKYFN